MWNKKMKKNRLMSGKIMCNEKVEKRYVCPGRKGRVKFLTVLAVLALLLTGCNAGTKGAGEPSPAGETDAAKNVQPAFTPDGDTVLAAEKEESVQVKAAADGSVQKVTVETSLFLPEGSGDSDIEDFTGLTDIKNTEGDEEFVLREDGTLIFENHGEDITYEGTSNEPLPVDVKISYCLDGKPLVIKKGVFTTEEKGFRRPMSFHEPLPL